MHVSLEQEGEIFLMVRLKEHDYSKSVLLTPEMKDKNRMIKRGLKAVIKSFDTPININYPV